MGDLDYKLRKAAEMGDAVELKVLLLQAQCNPGSKGYGGMTALMHAAYSGDTDCVKLLLPVSNVLWCDHAGRSAENHARDREHHQLAAFIGAYATSTREATVLGGCAHQGMAQKMKTRRV